MSQADKNYPPTLKFDRFSFVKVLGEGGQGEVCQY